MLTSISVTGLPSVSNLLPGYTVTGKAIPANTRILSVDSPSQVTLTANAMAGGVSLLAVASTGFSGDVAGDGTLSGFDGSEVSQAVTNPAGQPQIPAPAESGSSAAMVDPIVRTGLGDTTTIVGTRGQQVLTSVQITDSGAGLLSADLIITYDTNLLDIATADVTLDSSLVSQGWGFARFVDDATGTIRVSAFSQSTALGPGPVGLVNLNFSVPAGASAGVSPISLSNVNGTQNATRLNEGALVITPDIGTITIPIAVSINGPGSDSEGTPAAYTSSVSGNVGAVSYLWSVTKSGNNYPVINNTSSSFTFTPDDDANYVVRLDVTDSASPTPNTGCTTANLPVSNVAPTIAVSGAAHIDEGSLYSLTLGAVTDPGTDAVTTYVVHWGDGAFNTYTSRGVKTHAYADGPNTYSITVDLVDEDGTYLNAANVLSVIVDNLGPTIAISGAPHVNEGAAYSLTLGSVTDPGTDAISSYVVHWGDGATDTYSSNGIKTHAYADGPNTYSITVDLVDEDGTYTNAANPLSVIVDNVVPTISISGAAHVDEGSPYSLTLSAVSDSGADTVTSFIVHWGDGATDTYGSAGVKTHTYADGPHTYSVTVDLVDEDGTFLNCANLLSVIVDNVAPNVTPAADQSAVEGRSQTLNLGSFSDPGTDGNWSVLVSWGDTTSSSLTVASTGGLGSLAHTYSEEGPRVVTIKVTDKDGQFGQATFGVSVSDAPIQVSGVGVTAVQGQSVSNRTVATLTDEAGAFSDGGDLSATIDWGDSTGVSSATLVPIGLGINGMVYEVKGSHTFAGFGTFTMTVSATDAGGSVDSAIGVATVHPFQVSGFTATQTGFDVSFNMPAKIGVLNLYEGFNHSLGSPDVTVAGDIGGNVRGSVVWDSVTNTAHFVATGGPLAPDTYHVTLVSGTASNWTNAAGQMLDGDFNLTPGGNYINAFTVVAPTGRILSLPDFARGPGQDVDVSNTPGSIGNATSLRWPLSISDRGGVTSFSLEIDYDPALLSISGLPVGAGMAGWTVGSMSPTPGHLQVTASGPTLATGAGNLLEIQASVPSAAISQYGASQIIRISNINFNSGTISILPDVAIQKVAYFGDASGDGTLSGYDASLMARNMSGMTGALDDGFSAYPLTDPRLIGDVTGNGTVGALDASLVAQKSVLIATPQVPDVPLHGTLNVATIDPTVFIPANTVGAPGTTVNVPVSIADNAAGLQSIDLTINYNTALLDLSNLAVTLSSYLASQGWSLARNVSDSMGAIHLSAYSTDGSLPAGTPQILNLGFVVPATSAGGTATISINTSSINSRLNEGLLLLSASNGSVVISPVLGDWNRDALRTSDDIATMFIALTDLNAYKNHNGLTSGDLLAIGDINHDGAVNNRDLQAMLNLVIADHSGTGGGSGSSTTDSSAPVFSEPPSSTEVLGTVIADLAASIGVIPIVQACSATGGSLVSAESVRSTALALVSDSFPVNDEMDSDLFALATCDTVLHQHSSASACGSTFPRQLSSAMTNFDSGARPIVGCQSTGTYGLMPVSNTPDMQAASDRFYARLHEADIDSWEHMLFPARDKDATGSADLSWDELLTNLSEEQAAV